MKIIITMDTGDCEVCGSYDVHSVEAPEIDYRSYYDGHLQGGPSIEEALQEILEKLGHEVVRQEN